MVQGESLEIYPSAQMVLSIDRSFIEVEFWILSLSFRSLSSVSTQIHGNNLPLRKAIVNSLHKYLSFPKVILLPWKFTSLLVLVFIYWGVIKLVLKTFENTYWGCLNLPCLKLRSLRCICACNWGKKGNTCLLSRYRTFIGTATTY